MNDVWLEASDRSDDITEGCGPTDPRSTTPNYVILIR